MFVSSPQIRLTMHGHRPFTAGLPSSTVSPSFNRQLPRLDNIPPPFGVRWSGVSPRRVATCLASALAAAGVLAGVSVVALAPGMTRGQAAPLPEQPNPAPCETRWTMINVSPNQQQADCHLIEFPDGTKVLVDLADAADAPGVALAYLHDHKIGRIDLVVISHFHRDHYGRLKDLIESGVPVGRVAINLPGSRELADHEQPWGMDWDDVQSVLELLRKRSIPCFTPKAGDNLVDLTTGSVRIRLEVLCAFDGIHTPFGPTDVNDTSIVLRLVHGQTRALFTGDMNHRLGSWIAQGGLDVSAELLKVPHHGLEGCAPNAFLARVHAKVALVPAPRGLWLSERGERVRTFLARNGIPAFVSGVHGHVTVALTERAFTIMTEGNTWPLAP